MIRYLTDDRELEASVFISFANKVWPGEYDTEKTRAALSRTLNFTAYDGTLLVGCLRVLTDGYYFGTITERLVLPARENAPTTLYFGAQPEAEAFYEKNGCQKGLQSYVIKKKR